MRAVKIPADGGVEDGTNWTDPQKAPIAKTRFANRHTLGGHPLLHEVGTIERVIRSVRRAFYRPKEVIVVNDASTDGTWELPESDKVKGIDRLILHDSNRGKGAALRTGIRLASGDVVVIQDATSSTTRTTIAS